MILYKCRLDGDFFIIMFGTVKQFGFYYMNCLNRGAVNESYKSKKTGDIIKLQNQKKKGF